MHIRWPDSDTMDLLLATLFIAVILAACGGLLVVAYLAVLEMVTTTAVQVGSAMVEATAQPWVELGQALKEVVTPFETLYYLLRPFLELGGRFLEVIFVFFGEPSCGH